MIHEVFVESATHQQQIYQVLRKMEENNELTLEVIQNLKYKSKQSLDDIEKKIYNKHELTDEFVSEWY